MTSIGIKSTVLLDKDEIKKYIIIDILSIDNFSYEILGEDNSYIKNKVNCNNKFSTCFECNELITYLIKINYGDNTEFKFFKYDNEAENNIYNFYKNNIVMNIQKKSSLPNQHILNQLVTLHNMNLSSECEEDDNNCDEDNEFLEQVYQSYKSYRDFIISEKEKQKIQMEELLEYLENNLNKTNVTNEKMRKINHEQNNLLNKINGIRNELEELISNTK